jgi:cardiolipin synthase
MFKEYINLVKSAKKFIHISTYICCDGVFFYVLANELIKKAKAGVKVRFLIDGYGSMFKYSKKIIRLMKKAGIEIALFNYDGISIFNSATNYRNHKKILIIDNEKGVYGGSNISDEYIGISKEKNYFTDTNFLISGEIMNSLNVAFCSD